MHRELLQERGIADARVLAAVDRVVENGDPELSGGGRPELEQRARERLRVEARPIASQ